MCAICQSAMDAEGRLAVGGDKPTFSIEQIIAQLDGGVGFKPGSTINFTFLTNYDGSNPDYDGFNAFSETQREAVREAFALIAEIADIKFQEVADDGDHSDVITFGNSTTMPSYVWGWAGFYGGGGTSPDGRHFLTAGLVWVNSDGTGSYDPGTYNFTATIHEIMHVLGVPHPGAYNANGESITYEKFAEYEQDSRQYTVMSYFGAGNTGVDHNGSYGATPLLHDILILQHIYGANMTTRAGETVYGFNATAGRDAFDFTVNQEPVVAIWDAGGEDTIDLSGYAMSNLLDLRQGAFSSVGGLTGNLAVAYGAVIENAVGGSGDDLIQGNDADNRLDGGAGADTLRGGEGDDVYLIDVAADQVVEWSGDGDDHVFASVSYALAGTYVERLTLVGSADLDATGNSLDNVLTGNAGRNVLTGGGGDDIYVIQNEGDAVVEAAGEGIDTVHASLSHALAANVENLTLVGDADLDGVGNALDNILIGNAGINRLTGGRGDDTYHIQNAGDVMVEAAGEGVDTVVTTMSHTLGAHFENLVLAGADDLSGTGNALDNVLTGNQGRNLLRGGRGDDIYYVQTVGDQALELGGEGNDKVFAVLSWTLAGSYIEALELLGDQDLDATGNSLENTLIGNLGDNLLDGAGGGDLMLGGLGDDTYRIDSRSDRAVEASGEGDDHVVSSINFNLAGTYVERLTLAGSAKYGTGNSLDNTLTGNAALNVLRGETGDDTYFVQNNADRVIEANGEGNDHVISSADFGLSGTYVERLTLTGTAKWGVGNSLDNTLTGNAALNVLIGATGNDTYYVQNNDDRVVEEKWEGDDHVISSADFALSGTYVERLTLTGTAKWAVGNSLDNTLTGNDAANVLDGKTGADRMVGGKGDDTYRVDRPEDVVVEFAGEGVDTIESERSYTLATMLFLENITLVGSVDASATGNALNNLLIGNAGRNVLTGGDGDDTYHVQTAGDRVIEANRHGDDHVFASIDYALSGQYIERLTLVGSADLDAIGNSLDNTLTGNAGANRLAGQGGDDTYHVQNVSDRVIEKDGQGDDHVYSSISYSLVGQYIERLTLMGAGDLNATGNSLTNTLRGNAGANLLDGASGADVLIGNLGDDVYLIDHTGDRAVEKSGEGHDRVEASVSFSLGGQYIEDLTLLGDGDLDGEGNSLANRILGTSGANTLSGLGDNDVLMGDTDADTLIGGTGHDLLYGDTEGWTWSESDHGHGADRLEGGDGDDFLVGGLGDDTLLGGGGDDNLLGGFATNVRREDGYWGYSYWSEGGGADHYDGGAGVDYAILAYGDETLGISVDLSDPNGVALIERGGQAFGSITGVEDLQFSGGSGDDVVTGGVGVSYLYGNGGDDSLRGGEGFSNLDGNDGNDLLIAGRGENYLEGGSGDDTFAFQSTESLQSSWIFDYSDEDVIDLSAIDADASADGDQAFRLVDAFTGNADEVLREFVAGDDTTYFRFDLDGDGAADHLIALFGEHTSVDLVL